jgi:glycosyltransferase involved in cell wall biosynthesis
MHQLRPLRPGRSVTVIHDTIPLRFGGTAATRVAKRIYFLASALLSTRILVPSEFSRQRVAADLGLCTSRIDVMQYPVDAERAQRVAALRDRLDPEPVLLYIGRFAKHKNLERLCRAFACSDFRAGGGRLLLVGGADAEIVHMRTQIAKNGYTRIQLLPACGERELERLLATSQALISPSLEEGYGLPAFEAAACGLPVAVSPTGAMTELPPDVAVSLDPLDVESIRAAIDEATCRPTGGARDDLGGHDFAGTILRSLASSFREV